MDRLRNEYRILKINRTSWIRRMLGFSFKRFTALVQCQGRILKVQITDPTDTDSYGFDWEIQCELYDKFDKQRLQDEAIKHLTSDKKIEEVKA